ncbi:MAG: hypothetical protein OEV66_10165 [Spirochaetia bacterium]|nr:hypothetical protein [Spirochaetia bacterium]
MNTIMKTTVDSQYEVRLMKQKKGYLLLFKTNENRIGILYKISAALYVQNWNIIEMSATTSDDGIIEDTFLVEPMEKRLAYIMEYTLLRSIHTLLKGNSTVMGYISRYPGKLRGLDLSKKQFRKLEVNVRTGNQFELMIETDDRPGLIFEITQILYRLYFDILKMESQTMGNKAVDKILVAREAGKESKYDSQILAEALDKIVD